MIPRCLLNRLEQAAAERRGRGLFRRLTVSEEDPTWLNLADNDYLELARDPALIAAAGEAAERHGCSSSASPLITGYGTVHQDLERELCQWHQFPAGMLWNSGYGANRAVLSLLPRAGDLVLADRLIHQSMISGILQSGARLIRYRHKDIPHLRQLLESHASDDRTLFVVTESVFSMDGDAPDLAALAALKDSYPFCLVVDEAHAVGWHGPSGAGLCAETGVTAGVDVLVGTLGKAVGSQGAYTLFQNPILRDHLINHAGEFIYSTYLSPIAAAVARAGIERIRELSSRQRAWRTVSTEFRQALRDAGWEVAAGDSPIVPLVVGDSEQAVRLAAFLRENRILVGAVRPPTVPAGSSRLRISLKRSFHEQTGQKVIETLEAARKRHG